jgi:hypothetical protein
VPGNSLGRVPSYALNSEHAIIQAYVVKKYEIGDVREAREVIIDDIDLTLPHPGLERKHGKVEHAYGLTFPIRRCDFVAIDIDDAGEDNEQVVAIVKALVEFKIVERVDVILSSAYILKEEDHKKIYQYKFIDKDVHKCKFHIYAKLNGTYDCYSLYRSRAMIMDSCMGFWQHSIMHGEATIRISPKFYSPGMHYNSLAYCSDTLTGYILRSYSNRGQYADRSLETFKCPFRSTIPITILSGVRDGNGLDFKDYRQFVADNLNEATMYRLFDEGKKSTKKITFNIRREKQCT